MSIKKIIKLHDKGNCIIFGEKGAGKDVLTGNVIARRKKQYISNIDYTHDSRFIPLDLSLLDVGGNTFHNFINGDIKPYTYPYPLGADIFISDLGVYLPCQYNSELNKRYPHLPTQFALQRHLGESCMHGNTQDLRRPWDKLREQARRYILCLGVNQLLIKLGIVLMKVRVYSRYETAVAQVEPCRVTVPLFASKEARLNAQIYQDKFFNQHGKIETIYILCLNKSKHDTHYFRKLLGGVPNEKN